MSESMRLRAPYVIRQHGDPPETEGGRAAIPDQRGPGGEDEYGESAAGCLWREDGRVMYRGAAGGDPEAVRVVWALPLSGRGGPVSIMLAGKKKEAAYLSSLDALAGESRRVAEEELAAGMILPRITAIRSIRPRFGNYYWEVDTDMGPRRFLLVSPENNSHRPHPDVIIVRDVSGNCYEISPVSGLDRDSLLELDRVL